MRSKNKPKKGVATKWTRDNQGVKNNPISETTVQEPKKIIHDQSKNEKCETCSKCFKNQHRLNLHIKKRHASKNEKCEICPKSFLTKRGLKLHINKSHPLPVTPNDNLKLISEKPKNKIDGCQIDTNETKKCSKIEKCKFCPKTFSEHFSEHQKLDSTKSPFGSLELNNDFTKSINLKHKCEHCLRAFSQKINLKNHQTRDHSTKKPQTNIVERPNTRKSSRLFTSQRNTRRTSRLVTTEQEVELKCVKCGEHFFEQ